ncbi:PASTA domain-containing protein [Micromonospora sp. NPDC047134]|uniref:PASTA domain-containing protein n=1 Tax=Micromonospora sp. NPDC047134 TaxID=3154340 RepID=UPI0033E492F2
MSERGEEQPDDRTRPLPSSAADPDHTRPLPPAAADSDSAADSDQTAILGGTSGPPAADPTVPVPPVRRAEPWSGRAEVPPAGSGQERDLAAGEWYGDDPAGRRWWLPIVWGIALLLLLALLGTGLWLARQAVDEGDSGPPSPQPTTSAAPTSDSPSPTRSPSATPTTSAAPTTLPLPPLVGLTEEAARALLDRLDLEPQVEYRPSNQPAGTVIATDPGAGDPVESGDVVRLVVADPSPSTPAPEPPSTEPTTAPTTTDPTATASPTR